jgi:4-hydroxy-tetrahydrodipicolinate synthase
VLQRLPMISALKATIAHFLQEPAWRTVRPPLVELTSAQEADLVSGLAARGFDMPGIRG